MMKKKLLLTGMFVISSLAAKSQVGINTTNPQGIFNVDGLNNNPSTGIPTAARIIDELMMLLQYQRIAPELTLPFI
ncbi:hypothetical protein ACP3T3_09480 [Chryseobacterium sp. CBSDS_008]|uniref:hypothetical protein n=1 Tax=Chryseobacterium sp. CBSDS_008 TaxID=3415265 RepID=UPI003CF7E000